MNDKLYKRAIDNARSYKRDEFYTLYEEIKEALTPYKSYFENKKIYLPCDSEKSNFWKFFNDVYDNWKLAGLKATSLDNVMLEYGNEPTAIQDGSFESDLAKQLRDGCDIIVTNPPFSKLSNTFTEFIKDKPHFIITTLLSVSHRSVFKLICENKINHFNFKTKPLFEIPYEHRHKFKNCIDDGTHAYVNICSAIWQTTFPVVKRKLQLIPFDPTKYFKYDSKDFDIYNCDRIKLIPDCDELLAVPVSIALYDLADYDILGITNDPYELFGQTQAPQLENGRKPYVRFIIRKKQSNRNIYYDAKA